MRSQEIKKIMKKYDKYAKMLEEYDRTGIFPLDKIRRSFTIKQMNYSKLKNISEKTGKSMSDMIDDLIDKKLK